MGLFTRKPKLTTEQKVTQQQLNLTKAQIREIKSVRRRERLDKLQGQLGWVFKNTLPRGIRSPDSTVRNLHLYRPVRGKYKTILK